MNINFFIICLPNTMSKPLNWIKFGPFKIFRVEYLHLTIFTTLIGSAANYKHKCPYKNSSMLIPWLWFFTLFFWFWNINPSPIIVFIFFQKPCVIKCNLIICSSTKNYHIFCCITYLTYSSRVVCSCSWLVSWYFNFVPRKRCLFNV